MRAGWVRPALALALGLVVGGLGGCHLLFRHGEGVPVDAAADRPRGVEQRLERPPAPALDLLFVVDNSESMKEEQLRLAKAMPLLLGELVSLPVDLRIGVVSTDLGAGGRKDVPTCALGDGGRLQSSARISGCTPPVDAWISYAHGSTNVPGPIGTAQEKLADAFECISQLGTSGCGFEQPLQSLRLALESANPGFLRAGALLAVVLLTDEDDCSAQDAGLFDPTRTDLGLLASFRCFEHGIRCDQTARSPGPHTHCAPGGKYLHPPDEYVGFLAGLRAPERLLVAAIAGPVLEPVEVVIDAAGLEVKPSCVSVGGAAAPGIRIKALLDGLAARGAKTLFHNICGDDPGLGELAALLVEKLRE
jgi:hypothetical protein